MAYSCYHSIALWPQGSKLFHKVFPLPFIFPSTKPSSQAHPAYLSDALSCRALLQVLYCDLTCNHGFYIPQVSLCHSHHGGSCLHSSAPLESDCVNISWACFPTTPFIHSSVKSWWSCFGKKGLVVMYKRGERFSGSRNGISTLFKSNLWLCFQFLLGLPLFKGSLEYGFDTT